MAAEVEVIISAYHCKLHICCTIYFLGVFKKAWVNEMFIANTIGSSRATGVYPIDRRAAAILQLPQGTAAPRAVQQCALLYSMKGWLY